MHEVIIVTVASLFCCSQRCTSQVTFIDIMLFTIQIVSNQLYRDNRKIMQKSLFPDENRSEVRLIWNNQNIIEFHLF